MRSGRNCGTAGFTAFERRLMSDPDAQPRIVERRDLVAIVWLRSGHLACCMRSQPI